jgi:hypothetical protein
MPCVTAWCRNGETAAAVVLLAPKIARTLFANGTPAHETATSVVVDELRGSNSRPDVGQYVDDTARMMAGMSPTQLPRLVPFLKRASVTRDTSTLARFWGAFLDPEWQPLLSSSYRRLAQAPATPAWSWAR